MHLNLLYAHASAGQYNPCATAPCHCERCGSLSENELSTKAFKASDARCQLTRVASLVIQNSMLHQEARSSCSATIHPAKCNIRLSICRRPLSSCLERLPRLMQPLSALPSRKIDPSKFTAEQLAFLERKRAYKAGETLNPLQSFSCPECGGKGTVVCWECSGAGVNHRDIVEEVMGGSPELVRQQNGVVDVSWFLMKGGPCFVCRGKPECPCRACEGTGIRNFKIEQYCGD